ncbi:hypothetical protein GCM10009845_36300 [Pedococcus bigeumensis]
MSPDEAEAQTLEVPVGQKSSGEPVHESILVAVHGPDRYEVLASPAFAQGVARGDLVVQSAPWTELVVLQRGGNLALQVFAPHPGADELVPLVAEGPSCSQWPQSATVTAAPKAAGSRARVTTRHTSVWSHVLEVMVRGCGERRSAALGEGVGGVAAHGGIRPTVGGHDDAGRENRW